MKDTTSQEYFDRKYRRNPDPWGFSSSQYELSRYQAILDVLKPGPYHCTFEPGCSVGVLTERLAAFCERVEAMDISPTAVEQARKRCQNLPHVTINCGALPGDLPDGPFDLVVFSEIGYYFTEEHLARLLRQITTRLNPAGTLLAAHWLGNSKDHLLNGDRVHQIISEQAGLLLERSDRHEHFRIDLWKQK